MLKILSALLDLKGKVRSSQDIFLFPEGTIYIFQKSEGHAPSAPSPISNL